MDRRVRIGTPHGFLEGGKQVVVLVPILVVAQGAFLSQFLRGFQGDFTHAIRGRRGKNAQLYGIHRLADVSAAGQGNVAYHAVLNLKVLPAFFL